jgi:hypothetical protein
VYIVYSAMAEETEKSKTSVARISENYEDAMVGLKQRRSEFAVGAAVLSLWLADQGGVLGFPVSDEAITAGALLTLGLSAMSDKSVAADN